MKRVLFAILLTLTTGALAAQWQTIDAGLDHTVIYPATQNQPQKRLQAFRVDLKRYQLQLVPTKKIKQSSLFANQVGKERHALITINGGFFSPNMKPIGLRIHNGNVLSPLKKISWWGIFITQGRQAQIITKNSYRYSSNISFAVQSGPRLIINGRIPKLRPGIAKRSALCITKDGKVVVAITDHVELTTTQLAKLMQANLGCYNALNLDGGSSSQLFAHIKDFSLHVRSLRPVSDVIIVTKR